MKEDLLQRGRGGVIWSSFSILFIWSTTPLLFWFNFWQRTMSTKKPSVAFLSYGVFSRNPPPSSVLLFTSTRFSNVMDDKTWFVTNGLCAAIMTTAVTTTCTPFLDSPPKKWTASTFFGRWHQHDTHWFCFPFSLAKTTVSFT